MLFRSGVVVLPHKQRDVLLKQHRYFLSEHFSRLYPVQNYFATGEKGKDNPRDKFLKQLSADNTSLIALQCRRALPNKKQVRLMWGKGVSSVSGIATRADQPIAFDTRETFTARLNCERVNAKSDCIPILPMTLSFSAPIPTAAAKNVVLIGADGKRYTPEVKAQEGEPHDWISEAKFVGPFPEKAQFKLEIPAGLKDDAGRELANRERFPLTVKTDEYPPLAKFAANFGIIEAKGDPALPVTVRNIEDKILLKAATVPGKTLYVGGIGAEQKIITLLSRLRYMEGKDEATFFSGAEKTKSILLPKPGGKKEFEVIGIPLREPGLHVVEIASPRLGAALLQKIGRAHV